jgi:MscS family membrane protein
MQHLFLGNTFHDYLTALIILAVGIVCQLLFTKIIARLFFKILQKYSTETHFEDFVPLVRKPLSIFILLVTFYIAFNVLSFPTAWHLAAPHQFGLRYVLNKVFQLSIVVVLTWMLLRLVDYFGLVLMRRAHASESKFDDQIIPFFKESIKVIVLILAVFFVLGALFHINIASLVAGLGIGGLAVALAAKETLENLIGSFTIFLDKPFHVGDIVQFGTTTGTVERIGFRSTKLRTFEKTILVVPNKKIVDAELDNLSQRTERRVKQMLQLQQPKDINVLKAALAEIEHYVATHEQTTHEQKIRLDNFSAGSINILLYYFVRPVDWDLYIDIKSDINFTIVEILLKHDLRLLQAQYVAGQ